MKLLVRSLSRSTKEPEIRALFAAHGQVTECTLVMDQATGKSKGFAFVEMPNISEAQSAMAKLNFREIGGKSIRVKIAE